MIAMCVTICGEKMGINHVLLYLKLYLLYTLDTTNKNTISNNFYIIFVFNKFNNQTFSACDMQGLYTTYHAQQNIVLHKRHIKWCININ